MTAALTLMAKDRKGPKISYQVLLIPATDASVDRLLYTYSVGRFLPRAFMKYGWDLYAPDIEARVNPYVSPLRASIAELKDLPPALVITAENDPLRDEGEAYARKLKEAGVSVDAVRYNGTDPRLCPAQCASPRTLNRSRNRSDQRRPAPTSRARDSLNHSDCDGAARMPPRCAFPNSCRRVVAPNMPGPRRSATPAIVSRRA